MQAVSNKRLHFQRSFNDVGEPEETFIMEPDKPRNVPDWVQDETVFQLGLKPHLDQDRMHVPATIVVLDTAEQKKDYERNLRLDSRARENAQRENANARFGDAAPLAGDNAQISTVDAPLAGENAPLDEGKVE